MKAFIFNRVKQNTLMLATMGALFFILAGKLNLVGFWAYVATVLIYQVISLLILVPGHPEYIELAQVRKARRTDAKRWDQALVFIMMGTTFLMYALAALDVGRYHISELSLWYLLPGILLYCAGSALNQWAMLHNPHFESRGRIQTDRDHAVMTTGPYRWVRHPGYLGSILGLLSFPLILGSGLAFTGALLCSVGTVIRTYLEDKTLHGELPGYANDAQTIRHRLIPLVW